MTRITRNTALAVTIVLTLGLPASAAPLTYPAPVQDGLSRGGPPVVTASTWILYDDTLDVVLASFLPTEERPMASTTKIMTALVAIEESDLNSIVTVSQNAADTGEREIGLVAGEQFELRALLKAAMIHSANDAATAIAEHVGGTVEGFVVMMNQKAQELDLTETSFANPHGLDSPDHYSSARDLLDLALAAMAYPEFGDIVRSRVLVFPDAPDGTSRVGTTTNLLLEEYPGTAGIKTGFTNRAGLTFVSTAERDGRTLFSVVLGSEGPRAHFRDTEKLFDYGFERLGIYGSLGLGTPYTTVADRVSPGPLTTESGIETYLHLAGQGLMTSPPNALGPTPDPEPLPVTVVTRETERNPEPLHMALYHWWDTLFRG